MNRIHKLLCPFLCVALLCGSFSGCGNNDKKKTDSTVQAYLDMAQEYIDSGDYTSAVDVLTKGYDSTGSEEINAKLQEVLSLQATDTTTNATTETTQPSAEFDLSKYDSSVTYWASDGISYESGGCVLDIYIDSSTSCATFSFDYIGGAPSSRWAEIDVQKSLSEITGNKVDLHFETDGWGHSGDLSLLFAEDSISYTVSNVVCFLNDGPEWGVSDGQSGKLTSHPNPLEALTPPENNTPENNTPAYDPSKASGILAQAGLTEEQFINMCEPLGYQESFSRGNIPTRYEISFGKNFYAEYPDEEVIAKAKKEYENYAHLADKYKTFDDYLACDVYAKKGHELINNYTYELFEKMQEYPNEYLGKPYAIHIRVSPRKYIDTYDFFNGTLISINDLRDDTSAPNIMDDKHYIFYVIFNGTFSRYDGRIGLSFNLIALEKLS